VPRERAADSVDLLAEIVREPLQLSQRRRSTMNSGGRSLERATNPVAPCEQGLRRPVKVTLRYSMTPWRKVCCCPRYPPFGVRLDRRDASRRTDRVTAGNLDFVDEGEGEVGTEDVRAALGVEEGGLACCAAGTSAAQGPHPRRSAAGPASVAAS
jgi:hypothetical protein